MHRATTLFAAFVAGGLLCGAAHAGVGSRTTADSHLFESPDLPSDLTTPSYHANNPSTAPVSSPQLSLSRYTSAPVHLTLLPSTAGHLFVYSDFVVGKSSLAPLHEQTPRSITWRAPASTFDTPYSNFIRAQIVAPSAFDEFCDRFDVTDEVRPWSDTTTVHILASTKDWFVPFATIAYEEDSLELYDRFGIGGGLQLKLDDHTTFGAETVYFGDRLNDTLNHETRFLAKFQIEF